MPAESQPIAIIPLPAEIDRQAGVFTLTTQTIIVADEANQWNAAYLRNLLCAPTGFDLPVLGSSQNNFIELRLGAGAQTLGEDGYHLSVSGGSVPQAATPHPNRRTRPRSGCRLGDSLRGNR
jgi:hypothetical protein